MKGLRTLINYYFYCGIDKEEYNAVKKNAYISNFNVWRILHLFIAIVCGILFTATFFLDPLKINRAFYFSGLVYSSVVIIFFYILKKDSVIAQLIIYLSITLLFLLGCCITSKNPVVPATTFITMLLITPMFMIDRPVFMTIELCSATAIFILWMHKIKEYEIWRIDVINVIIFTVVGIFLNVVANSIRIKEFVLTRQIKLQKDIDEMTGLSNKSALTRKIDKFLADTSSDKGIMFMLDIDHFKMINDTYGHDIGDDVILQLGHFLGSLFTGEEIVGRFGGDEFIVFIKNTNDEDFACRIANEIISKASDVIVLPEKDKKVSVSIGIALYNGLEKSYSEIFKKADLAMYKSKASQDIKYNIYM